MWLVLAPARNVGKGTVSVDLSAALYAVGGLLENNYGWKDFADSYWLDTISFGIEFGQANATPYGNGSTRFDLALSAYCLEPGAKVSTATC